MNHFRLDTNDTKLQQHVQYYAEPIFPKLDSDGEERVQDQVMHDTRGNPWEFCHIYRVQHDQHKLLPIEWSRNYMAGALDEQIDASVRQHCLWNLQASWRFVFNSSRVLEERYLKQPLGDLGFKRSWAVDPVAPEADVVVSCGGQAAVELADLRTWLNMFLEGSIVKTVRESMNRMIEAWREIPDLDEEVCSFDVPPSSQSTSSLTDTTDSLGSTSTPSITRRNSWPTNRQPPPDASHNVTNRKGNTPSI
ncbi:hypothetical protein ACJX0J_007241, partial [Zea mays]